MRTTLSCKLRIAESTPRAGLRRGISTVWALVGIPVLVTLLIFVLETAHLWLSRLELQAALEAGALAGVKRWTDITQATNPEQDPGVFTTTHAARIAAQAAAGGNTVSGNSVLLGLNEHDDGNTTVEKSGGGFQPAYDNASCTGDILLGGVNDPNLSNLTTFSVESDVGCGRNTSSQLFVSVNIDVITTGGKLGDPGDTSNTPDAFQISYTAQAGHPFPPGTTVTTLQINLQNTNQTPPGPAGNGVFQPYSGVGGAGEANGYGPIFTAGPTPTSWTVTNSGALLTLTFPSTGPNSWTPGTVLKFGIDTDFVNVGSPGSGIAQNFGGDFGVTGGASTTSASSVQFLFGFNGSSPPTGLNKTLQTIAGNTHARLQGGLQTITLVIPIPNVSFAVMTQKTVTVKPLFGNIFGNLVGNYNISGRAFATSQCTNPTVSGVLNPQAVYVTGTICP